MCGQLERAWVLISRNCWWLNRVSTGEIMTPGCACRRCCRIIKSARREAWIMWYRNLFFIARSIIFLLSMSVDFFKRFQYRIQYYELSQIYQYRFYWIENIRNVFIKEIYYASRFYGGKNLNRLVNFPPVVCILFFTILGTKIPHSRFWAGSEIGTFSARVHR